MWALLLVPLLLLDRLFPLPGEPGFSLLVTARDGTPLRAFPDEHGAWRYPITPDAVSPLYLSALLNYEDRFFHHHPGVNPVALVRAALQWGEAGRPLSGGSTLTMQVARLLDPVPRTIPGKFRQILRALQLELHYSKQEILALYLNRAPFGGPIEGVEAAAFAYLGHSARTLSLAEAALLAVLPQAPSRLRPDRWPERARKARDKVLERLANLGVITWTEAREAKREGVDRYFRPQPLLAPLLALRLKADSPAGAVEVASTLDSRLQWSLENRVNQLSRRLPAGVSLALLVVDNQDLSVVAYIGSANYFNESRLGHVDMVRARRSPGSTLKPFLYAMALDEGLIHSESLLVDAPQSFDGYRPVNFDGKYQGPVSAREALQRSLNIPAVDLMDRLHPERFASRLEHGGLPLVLPKGEKANLSVILGGAGASLEHLVGAYTALARGGMAGRLRLRPGDPLVETRLFSPEAAWIVRRMLATAPRPGLAMDPEALPRARQVAWKTGTSYGFRDAWAVGVTDRFTIALWAGRPDGTPSPGQFGARTALPLLLDVVDSLPARLLWDSRAPDRPAGVGEVEICWPLGTAAAAQPEGFCHVRRRAWSVGGTVPPTLPDRLARAWGGATLEFTVNAESGLLLDASCTATARETRRVALWPMALEPWLPANWRRELLIPKPDPSCAARPDSGAGRLKIKDFAAETVVRRAGEEGKDPVVNLAATGGEGGLYWLVNGRFLGETAVLGVLPLHFKAEEGVYEVTVFDETGQYDRVRFRVER